MQWPAAVGFGASASSRTGEDAVREFRHVEFPGRAGQLQAAGATAELIDELGGNYRRYHKFLADELERSGPPEKDDHKDIESYLRAWARAQELVQAEAFLRYARESKRVGGPPRDGWRQPKPLYDERNRLVSVDD